MYLDGQAPKIDDAYLMYMQTTAPQSPLPARTPSNLEVRSVTPDERLAMANSIALRREASIRAGVLDPAVYTVDPLQIVRNWAQNKVA